ncbi:MAG: histidinol-phosphate transaminase [Zetaproteobacteria bacterium CG12_big_fil_rev_8_21_14_0_65_55_1124]|nr:MAG: histidinol-phosphate transaminase [Zetaproteobacteria bacterium CG1_02_55_237]PIS18569.1 MAG: histidinol-phosphate transaminase [Zetaproteobacteria bacterium CG08_land_8_20_14_0_20_55_17]PIW42045.1 MAG: histidinol-phosphate transaminase [Zetaproteobacteria bacterium CG12_big_fil_rev_8_21_14_0_65_55_1124]PIY53950.1 MAG: histidinol-phosphate transaminase [Zetaproteobacteria bacterium CG_4_10_14_0_8_um_filter_55_43]PIZ39396.1 MAG: histidinol-phosphate transaminase [Zetaproteobacteria bacte
MTTVDWSSRCVAQCARLHPYIPGKPVEQLLREKGLSHAVKLASNENPYGPAPAAVEAIRKAAAGVHRYPNGDCTQLKQALATRHGVSPAQVLPGNGSNEVLELIIRTFAGPGDEVIYAARGFIVYALATTAAGATGVAVPEQDGVTHDLEGMLQAVNANTKLVCIANPNNPTGSLLSEAALQTFFDALPRDVIVVLDEAYHEFVHGVEVDSMGRLHHPGLVICRTFSKAYGLAGLRIGYAVGDAALLAQINRFREPFNVNLLAQQAALAALGDTAWLGETVTETLSERQRLEDFLCEISMLGSPSHGNFVLLRHAEAGLIAGRLEDHGIIPRPLAPYGMPDWLRISVGTPQENDSFMSTLSDIMASIGEQA